MKIDNYLVEKIIEFILSAGIDDFSQLNVGQIAFKFNMKMSYISRKFKEETKMLLSKFIEYERLKRAEELLKIKDNTPIEEISRMIGFETCHHFRKKFKEKNGITPGFYKKIMKKLKNNNPGHSKNIRCKKCKHSQMGIGCSSSRIQLPKVCPRLYRYTVGCCDDDTKILP
jgi:AraC-like DNA-binding protein